MSQTTSNNGVPRRRLDPSQVWHIVAKITCDQMRALGPPRDFFRHAYATHSMDAGAPLRLLIHTLDHTDLRIAARYQHVLPETPISQYLEF